MVTDIVDREGANSWCEIDIPALSSNVSVLRNRIGVGTQLGIVVKSDAYGHGMIPCARAFLSAGADWLIVNSVTEAVALREEFKTVPIYICGHVSPEQAPLVISSDSRVVLYDWDFAQALAKSATKVGKPARVHIKLETGMHRQGVEIPDAIDLAERIVELEGVSLEGLATHFADSDNTEDHSYSEQQTELLNRGVSELSARGIRIPVVHSANSAATILWSETHGHLVRVGISAYGLWPAAGVRQESAHRFESDGTWEPGLKPVLGWKARIAQVKEVAARRTLGYGRTHQADGAIKLAVIPIGYFEGYDRRLSNKAHVLVNGQRAPVRGRVCMNMITVEVTDIPCVEAGTVATLLGRDGDEEVSADQIASWIGTINYEVTTRIHPGQPRVVIDRG
ncbi:MAG TPA: alanine racemase [Candidatus Latescibacteria bacterium]|nr:alanine racemase [Candidatus Latescibacterota bacterium]